MSYCRFGEGDVYLYRDFNGLYVCCGCNSLHPIKTVVLHTPEETLKHLEDHRLAGDAVPERAFNRLRKEIEDENNHR